MLHQIDLAHPSARACVNFVCENLRTADRKEVKATPGKINDLKRTFVGQGNGLVITQDSTPAAVLWWYKPRFDTCLVAMLATPQWTSVARGVSRIIRKSLIPDLSRQGVQQALCLVDESNNPARRWLEWIGFGPCDELPDRGRNGENFLVYRYLFERTLS